MAPLDKLLEAIKHLGFTVISRSVREPNGKPPRITLVLEPGEEIPEFTKVQTDAVSALVNLGSNEKAATKAVVAASKVVDATNFNLLFMKALEMIR